MNRFRTSRRFFMLMVAGAAAMPLTLAAQAPSYPDKPIKLIIPWPAGGLVDVLGRAVGNAVGDALGQPVVVENRTGAGGSMGAATVASAAPDGYTLLLSTSALTMNAALGVKTSFDLFKDFEPVAIAAYAPSILVCNNDLPVKSVGDLIALAKREPGRRTYGSAGIGSPAHFSGELLKSLAGIDMTHVAYKGAPAAMLDVIAGRVDCLFANITVGQPQIKAGKVRPLAVTSEKRIPTLPDLPTMAEAGVPGFEADQWLGFLAPTGTPGPIVDVLNKEINRALLTANVRTVLEQNGMTVAPATTPTSSRTYIRSDFDKWTSLVKKASIRLE